MAVSNPIRNIRMYFDEFAGNSTAKLRLLANRNFLNNAIPYNYAYVKGSTYNTANGTGLATSTFSGNVVDLASKFNDAGKTDGVVTALSSKNQTLNTYLSQFKTTLSGYQTQINSYKALIQNAFGDSNQVSQYLTKNVDMSKYVSGLDSISSKLNQFVNQNVNMTATDVTNFINSVKNDSVVGGQLFNKLFTFSNGTFQYNQQGDEQFAAQFLTNANAWQAADNKGVTQVDFSAAKRGKTSQQQRQLIGQTIGDAVLNSGFYSANRNANFTRDARFDVNAEKDFLKNLGEKLWAQSSMFDSSTGAKKLAAGILNDVSTGKFTNTLNSLLPNTGETVGQYKQRLGREIEVRTSFGQLDSSSPYLREARTARRTLKPPRTNETGQDDDQTKLGRITVTGVS